MKRTEIKEIPEYFDRYINLVQNIDLFEAFEQSKYYIKDIELVEQLKNCKNNTYLPNKWTIKEILQHITDIERLLTAGTLRFVRGESDYVISFDEENIAKKSKANDKQVEQIIAELIAVRNSTIALYKSFDEFDFQQSGINWKHRITVEAMGFNIIGHQILHINFIKENYFTLFK